MKSSQVNKEINLNLRKHWLDNVKSMKMEKLAATDNISCLEKTLSEISKEMDSAKERLIVELLKWIPRWLKTKEHQALSWTQELTGSINYAKREIIELDTEVKATEAEMKWSCCSYYDYCCRFCYSNDDFIIVSDSPIKSTKQTKKQRNNKHQFEYYIYYIIQIIYIID